MSALFIPYPVAVPAEFGGASASYIAFKFIEAVAPMVAINEAVIFIPGGVHLEHASLDVIVDADEAEMLGHPHPLQNYVERHGVNLLYVIDTSFSVSVAACIEQNGGVRCYTELRPWFDPLDACLELVCNARRPSVAGQLVETVTVRPAEPLIEARISVDRPTMFDAGFEAAEGRIAAWRALCGTGGSAW